MSESMLRAMARGGIYDQVGGGFARYAVDATWTVPHFEKMLYDNALLARAYLHGWQVSSEPLLRRVCCETLDWALRELRGPEGGFCSALDADSEGVEGKYYVWSLAELREALAPLGDDAVAGRDRVLRRHASPATSRAPTCSRAAAPSRPQLLAQIRARLYEVRERRVRPGLDDKRLCSWNALMISALAEAGAALERPDYVSAAVACAEFVLRDMVGADGRLLRTYKDGRAHIDAYLEDHAYLLEAMLTLYEATLDPRWYREAVRLAEVLRDRFADPEHGGFFTTGTGPGQRLCPAQGPRRRADPRRRLVGRVRAAAPGRAVGLARVRVAGARRAAGAGADRRAPSTGVRPRAAGARLLSRARARGGGARLRPRL